MISTYFTEIKRTIDNYSHVIENYSMVEKIYSEEIGFIQGTISFINESSLDFAEVKNIEIKQKIKYRYHYMDRKNQIIFRYDNSKHYPEIKTFPHHMHLLNETIETSEPEIDDILSEIEKIILK